MKRLVDRLIKFNRRLATHTTILFGTMWAAYVCLFWSMIPIFAPSWQTLVFYVSGGVVQLVALPLIMVGQNVLSEADNRRAEQDHKTLMAEFKELKEMHAEMKKDTKNLERILANQQEILDRLENGKKKEED